MNLRIGGTLSSRSSQARGRQTVAKRRTAQVENSRVPHGFPGNEELYNQFCARSGISDQRVEQAETAAAIKRLTARMERLHEGMEAARKSGNVKKAQHLFVKLSECMVAYGASLETMLIG
jgi:leucyl-tRNA synthetase